MALLVACVSAAAYYYTPPEVGCKWGATIDKKSAFTHTKTKIWVFGNFYKSEVYNHNDDLVRATVYRPDYDRGARFSFDGFTCSVSEGEESEASLSSVVGFSSKNFDFLDKAEWDGTDCFVYYLKNATPRVTPSGETVDFPNTNNAWYVDEDGYLIAKVENDDDWSKRVVTEYKYHGSIKVVPGDFSFSKSYAYACSDDRVFHNPDMYFAKCTASTTSVILSVVFAALVACFVLVF